jgi:hypothetical protein
MLLKGSVFLAKLYAKLALMEVLVKVVMMILL